MSLPSGSQPKFALISENTIATNELVAAVAGKRIRVLSYVVSAPGGANDVNFESATTDITGVIGLADNGSVAVASPDGLFETAVGAALALTQTAATVVGGHLTYVEV